LPSEVGDGEASERVALKTLFNGGDPATGTIRVRLDDTKGHGFEWERRGAWGEAEVTQTMWSGKRASARTTSKRSDPPSDHIIAPFLTEPLPGNNAVRLFRWARALESGRRIRDALISDQEAYTAIAEAADAFSDLWSHGIEYLAALRGLAFAERRPGPVGRYIGPHGGDVLRIAADESQAKRLRSQEVQGWLTKFGMTELTAGWKKGMSALAHYSQGGVDLPLDRGSDGQRQAFIFVVTLLMGGKLSAPRTLLVDAPELHMHPRWERQLADLFRYAVHERNTQLVAATHSEVFVASCAQLVRKGELSHKDLAIYEFSRSRATGEITATPLSVSPSGDMAHWVPSFAKVEDELWAEWIEDVPEAPSNTPKASEPVQREVKPSQQRSKARKSAPTPSKTSKSKSPPKPSPRVANQQPRGQEPRRSKKSSPTPAQRSTATRPAKAKNTTRSKKERKP
jgi:hypothetical protein